MEVQHRHPFFMEWARERAFLKVASWAWEILAAQEQHCLAPSSHLIAMGIRALGVPLNCSMGAGCQPVHEAGHSGGRTSWMGGRHERLREAPKGALNC